MRAASAALILAMCAAGPAGAQGPFEAAALSSTYLNGLQCSRPEFARSMAEGRDTSNSAILAWSKCLPVWAKAIVAAGQLMPHKTGEQAAQFVFDAWMRHAENPATAPRFIKPPTQSLPLPKDKMRL